VYNLKMGSLYSKSSSISPLANITAYTILIGLTIYILFVERHDVKCPSFEVNDEKECNLRGGMAFSDTKPSASDECDVLFDKVAKAAGAEQSSIKWRRSLTLAVGIMSLVWFLVITPGGLPNWIDFYLTVILAFIVIMGTFIYYSYHVYKIPEEWIRDSIAIIKEKCVI
jgi:hypothetical protein